MLVFDRKFRIQIPCKMEFTKRNLQFVFTFYCPCFFFISQKNFLSPRLWRYLASWIIFIFSFQCCQSPFIIKTLFTFLADFQTKLNWHHLKKVKKYSSKKIQNTVIFMNRLNIVDYFSC